MLLADSKVMYDLVQHVILNIDRSLCALDQNLIMITIDLAQLLSEHIKDYSDTVCLPETISKDEPSSLEDKMRKDFER